MIKAYLGLLLIFLIVSCKSDTAKIVKNTNSGSALGTTYSMIYFSTEKLDFRKEIDSVFAVMNQSLSTYIPTSDISKINKGDSTIVVNQMFQEVFQLSKNIFKKTNGYFDPTVGTLVNAWGFGPGKQIKMDSAAVDSLLKYVGFHKVRLAEDNTIRKQSPAIYFDFNAIAKGYAVDRLAVLLNEKGIENYLVEVGGEIVVRGENTQKQKQWMLGVDDPQMGEERTSKAFLFLKDKGLASSGNYRKFRIDSITGKKYVHTINPKTGYTKNSNVLGATVIANTCAEADAYATSFMAMDLKDTQSLLKSQKTLEAYIIYLDKNGDTQEFMTEGFRQLVVNKK
ncbi:MAG: FAD:protein FMN transferase [Cellulophaga sp.]